MRFDGYQIMEVESGTVVKGPHDEELTVTDTEAVFKGRAMYCTSKVVAELRKRSIPTLKEEPK